MEKNSVMLDIDRYNELYNFKKNIENNHVIAISNVWDNGNQNTKIYTPDGMVKEIAKVNDDLKQEILDLKQEISDLKHDKEKELTITEIKNLSLWKFLKWRKR